MENMGSQVHSVCMEAQEPREDRHKKGLSSRWKSFFSLIDDNANERRQDIEGSSNISQAANFLSQRYHNLLKAQNNHFSLGDNPN